MGRGRTRYTTTEPAAMGGLKAGIGTRWLRTRDRDLTVAAIAVISKPLVGLRFA